MKKYLLAPWRSEYISNLLNSNNKSCIFCDAIKNPGAPVVKKGEKNFIIMNIFPYNSGHIMVVPKEHKSDIVNLTADELNEMMHLTQESISILKKLFKPDGFNIGINMGKSAGAGFADHLHLHIVPRWQGDENFMSVVAETKVVSVDIKKIFEKLKVEFEK